jgi:hypothetical protein
MPVEGLFSRTKSSSRALVIAGPKAYVLFERGFASYDISNPADPKLLREFSVEGEPMSGTAVGDCLVIAEGPASWEGDSWVAVYNVADPAQIRQVGKVETKQSAFGLHALPGGQSARGSWVRITHS